MSRIARVFVQLRGEGRTALVTFITAGDPQPQVTVALMHRLVAAGADIIELGVPFSDPVADGPVIQKSSERALLQGVSLRQIIDMVSAFRATDKTTPVVLMGYLNPIEVMGAETFASTAAAAGVDGVLTVDAPPEESEQLNQVLQENGLDPIYLLAPTSTEARINQLCGAARGFVYYVSMKGVTGASHLDMTSVEQQMQRIRRATDLPVGVGFGIKDGATAALMSALADAVIVGSAIVRLMEDNQHDQAALADEVAAFVGGLRAALDAAKDDVAA
jgi:tryptophan synthase alpha chain